MNSQALHRVTTAVNPFRLTLEGEARLNVERQTLLYEVALDLHRRFVDTIETSPPQTLVDVLVAIPPVRRGPLFSTISEHTTVRFVVNESMIVIQPDLTMTVERADDPSVVSCGISSSDTKDEYIDIPVGNYTFWARRFDKKTLRDLVFNCGKQQKPMIPNIMSQIVELQRKGIVPARNILYSIHPSTKRHEIDSTSVTMCRPIE